MTISSPPTHPARGQAEDTFDTNAQAWMEWLEDDFVPEANALASALNVGVTKWVSGTTYNEGVLVWSPADFQNYRRKSTGAGTTDPSADSTNWALAWGARTTVARGLENVGLAVTMAANAVTIALKGADGNDPAAGNPVGIDFRSATLTNGQASRVSVTGALSTVISSGSTGGSVSGEASRVWIGALLTGGASELCWSIRRSGQNVLPIDEGGVISTTAEGGAGAADTAGTWYSTTARTNVPFVILGYFDSTQATAGTWATSPTSVVVNPQRRPGQVVQSIVSATGAVATGTTVMVLDDTIPQNTEGDEYMTVSVTPTSASNLLFVKAHAQASNSNAGGHLITALFKDSVANALKARSQKNSGATSDHQLDVEAWVLAGGTSAITFKNRLGNSAAGTTTFNGNTGARELGGVMDSYMLVQEVSA